MEYRLQNKLLKIILPQNVVVPIYGADGLHMLQQGIQFKRVSNVKGDLALKNALLLFL